LVMDTIYLGSTQNWLSVGIPVVSSIQGEKQARRGEYKSVHSLRDNTALTPDGAYSASSLACLPPFFAPVDLNGGLGG
jgi:hypothetical protein